MTEAPTPSSAPTPVPAPPQRKEDRKPLLETIAAFFRSKPETSKGSPKFAPTAMPASSQLFGSPTTMPTVPRGPPSLARRESEIVLLAGDARVGANSPMKLLTGDNALLRSFCTVYLSRTRTWQARLEEGSRSAEADAVFPDMPVLAMLSRAAMWQVPRPEFALVLPPALRRRRGAPDVQLVSVPLPADVEAGRTLRPLAMLPDGRVVIAARSAAACEMLVFEPHFVGEPGLEDVVCKLVDRFGFTSPPLPPSARGRPTAVNATWVACMSEGHTLDTIALAKPHTQLPSREMADRLAEFVELMFADECGSVLAVTGITSTATIVHSLIDLTDGKVISRAERPIPAGEIVRDIRLLDGGAHVLVSTNIALVLFAANRNNELDIANEWPPVEGDNTELLGSPTTAAFTLFDPEFGRAQLHSVVPGANTGSILGGTAIVDQLAGIMAVGCSAGGFATMLDTDGFLACFEAATGSTVWTVKTRWPKEGFSVKLI